MRKSRPVSRLNWHVNGSAVVEPIKSTNEFNPKSRDRRYMAHPGEYDVFLVTLFWD